MSSSSIGPRRAAALCAAAVLFIPQPTEAWNPLADLGHFFGSIIGAPFGGAIEAAVTPTIQGVEGSGHRLIQDLDERLANTARGLLERTDATLAARLDQVDDKLAARILQVGRTGDELVDRSLGQVDEISRKRIQQAARAGKEMIRELETGVQKDLATVDDILRRRSDQLEQIVSRSVAQVDQVVAARIDQADEALGRRIGNVDVLLTKKELNVEGAVVRIGGILAAVGLLAFLFWRAWVETNAALDSALGLDENKYRHVFAQVARRFGLQLALAAVAAGGLYFVSHRLTMGPRHRQQELLAVHDKALRSSLAALNFTGVRYHASQLELLDQDDKSAKAHRGLALKSELLRAALTRPTLLRSPDGVRELVRAVNEVESTLDEPDPDVQTIKAYVLWQIGATRDAEYRSAVLCMQALSMPGSDRPGRFLLQPLARHYLALFLDNPSAPAPTVEGETTPSIDELRAARSVTTSPSPPSVFVPLQHVFAYDSLAEELDRSSTNAYVAMIEAHADFLAARAALPVKPTAAAKLPSPQHEAMVAARERRRQHAREVIDAWSRFDEGLQSSEWLAGNTSVLAAFELNDAVLTQALWFDLQPDTSELPPLLGAEGKSRLSPSVRAQIAPLRVAWARRYAAMMGSNVRDVLSFEEAQRFIDYQRGASNFASATVEFLLARKNAPGDPDLQAKAERAALAAAKLGLYVGAAGQRIPYAQKLLEGRASHLPRRTQDEIRNAYQLRHVRYL